MKAIKWVGLAALAAMAGAAHADEGNWMVRARALYMNVDNDNKGGLNLAAQVEAENKTFPEVDISYFFTPNIAAELILTYPQKHDVTLGGTDIGSVKHLPPTLTLQYHFNPTGTIRPYAGLGLNYTRFSSVKLDAGSVLGGSVPLKIDQSSFGWAAQIGADFQIAPQWFFNVDLKYVAIDTDIRVKASGAKVTQLNIDPLLFSVGVGYRF
ncbi:MAG: outer membrane beta-barrel protein [Gammaproteobacteria bacterium]|jgi:outer membrane protein|nr:outer membrane beta-barrel protein [Gammaproteobacteria bacterium]MBU0770904.1 outer membrane beta-barrel protein [Gammaproteobacteria bacterium]MBU0856814.1 outer membrane beta-barrel protein [Gammaproteobacteria bacterium]MBU1845504.1 outer membrane beta-barrel protein [Gammaproteobacteria bacterium]